MDDDSLLKCSICFDSNTYPGNEIVSCGKCKATVHKKCYDVKPAFGEEAWLCDVCQSGDDNATPLCELCSNVGGALKKSDQGKWVHTLCCNWIPEVYVRDLGQGEFKVTLNQLDKKRYRLKCQLCSSKGACIQCAYGRCASAAHPWCIHHCNQGWTKRVVKLPDGEPIWEMFCKQHASCVTEPVRPRPKPKPQPVAHHGAEYDPYLVMKAKSRQPYKLTMAHALRFDKADKPPSTLAAGAMAPYKRGSSTPDPAPENATTFPIYTMDEWPGQTDGEPLDLPHFWRVVAMAFPEDQPPSYRDSMLETARKILSGPTNATMMDGLYPLGRDKADMERWETRLDGLFAAMGSDRDRVQVMDLSKWSDNHATYERILKVLRGELGNGANASGSSSSSDATEGLLAAKSPSTSDNGNLSQAPPEPLQSAIAAKEAAPVGTLPENDFLLKEMGKGSGREATSSTMDVCFDGDEHRVRASFEVKLGEGAGNGATAVELNSQNDAASSSWIEEHLIGAAPVGPLGKASPGSKASISLASIGEQMKDNKPVRLADRLLIAKEEDDFVSRMIRSDQKSYRELLETCGRRVNTAVTSKEWADATSSTTQQRRNWKSIETKYAKQRVWRKVATCMTKGMKDQTKDFNKPKEEVVPASWALEVSGRPSKDKLEKEEDDEAVEDAVCMVCFNGVSEDTNAIVFCDGCNATIHQACYGVKEVPEGDFFCDRCTAVTEMVEDPAIPFSVYDCGTGVMCCLCPLQHGGLKRTTDGRWCHLACASWTKEAIITDLDNMGPIDVTKVSVQAVVDENSRANRLLARTGAEGFEEMVPTKAASGEVMTTGGSKNYPYKQACMFCNVLGGFLVPCCGGKKKLPCGKVMHPLCGWFAGVYLETRITDVTFQALQRGGNYPAGISFSWHCLEHTPEVHRGHEQRKMQKTIRVKYKISEDDLEGMPGKAKRYKKPASAPKPKPPPPVVKDLSKDTYHRICAACLGPLPNAQAAKAPAKGGFEKTSGQGMAGTDSTAVTTGPTSTPSTHTIDTEMGAGEEMEDGGVPRPDAMAVVKKEDAAPTQVPKGVVTCSVCKAASHVMCHVRAGGNAADADDPKYQCDSCARNIDDPRCIFCPRRGGLFKPTSDGRWCHIYCGNSLGGVSRLAGNTDLRIVPKAFVKQKCCICTHKHGGVVKCQAQACNNYFHSLCGEKTGRGYYRVRNGIMTAFCSEHVPDGIEKVAGGYWVDAYESSRLRYTLERARLIMDTLNRREKYKRSLSKIEGEAFVSKFYWLLDKAKGRKPRKMGAGATSGAGDGDTADENDDDSDSTLSDTESEASEDEFLNEIMGKPKKPYKPKRGSDISFVYGDRPESKGKAAEEAEGGSMKVDGDITDAKTTAPQSSDAMDVLTSADTQNPPVAAETDDENEVTPEPGVEESATNGEKKAKRKGGAKARAVDPIVDEHGNLIEHRISGYFTTKKGELSLPKSISASLAGMTFKPKSIYEHNGPRSFTKEYTERMDKKRAEFRESVGVFGDTDEYLDFVATIGPQIKKWVNLSERAFISEMEKVDEEDGAKKVTVKFLEDDGKGGGLFFAKKEKDRLRAEAAKRAREEREGASNAAKKRKKKAVYEDDYDTEEDDYLADPVEYVEPPPKRQLTEAEIEKELREQRKDAAVAFSKAMVQAEVAAESASEEVGPFINHVELASLLANDHLTATLFSSAGQDFSGYSRILGQAGLQYVDDAGAVQDNQICTGDELITLECRIQSILNAIEDYEVEDEEDEPTLKEGGKSAQDKEEKEDEMADEEKVAMRNPIEDFRDVPYDIMPDYQLSVRRAIGFDEILEKLRMHRYDCMSALEKDFYDMLNNSRIVTKSKSLTWQDSELLATVFREKKKKAEAITREVVERIHSPNFEVHDKKPLGNEACVERKCQKCKRSKFITDWAWKSKEKEHPAMSEPAWQWLCPACLTSEGRKLVGQAVNMWWHFDSEFFVGTVDAFDEVTGRHRIIYEDGEWTFYNLGHEVALLKKAGEAGGKSKAA